MYLPFSKTLGSPRLDTTANLSARVQSGHFLPWGDGQETQTVTRSLSLERKQLGRHGGGLVTSNRRELVDPPEVGGKTFPEEGTAVTKTLMLGGFKRGEGYCGPGRESQESPTIPARAETAEATFPGQQHGGFPTGQVGAT